jgi:hypothetical protein
LNGLPVPRRRRKKRRWLRALGLFVITPLAVWLLAFLIWFFWHDIAGVSTRPGAGSLRDGESGQSRDGRRAKRTRETIPDEDRKKLDDILKRR